MGLMREVFYPDWDLTLGLDLVQIKVQVRFGAWVQGAVQLGWVWIWFGFGLGLGLSWVQVQVQVWVHVWVWSGFEFRLGWDSALVWV